MIKEKTTDEKLASVKATNPMRNLIKDSILAREQGLSYGEYKMREYFKNDNVAAIIY